MKTDSQRVCAVTRDALSPENDSHETYTVTATSAGIPRFSRNKLGGHLPTSLLFLLLAYFNRNDVGHTKMTANDDNEGDKETDET